MTPRRFPRPEFACAADHVWVEVVGAPGGWVSYRGPIEDAVATARRVWSDWPGAEIIGHTAHVPTPEQHAWSRKALGKALYSRIFG